MAIAVVWLKRDLRLSDHQPLHDAINTGLPVLLVYCFEPMLMDDPHYSSRHWLFVKQSLRDLRQRLPNGALYVSDKTASQTFNYLHQKHQISVVFSHQEVGLENTFQRDRAFSRWCQRRHIEWYETPLGAVIRGLTHRGEWDEKWQKVMRHALFKPDILHAKWVNEPCNEVLFIHENERQVKAHFQAGGEQAALECLDSFFETRGKVYFKSLSSPILSREHCSRLSAYLAWGNLSLRQVYQTLLSHWQTPGWRRSLVALSSRLHWHCHFIQKFESECEMQFRHLNAGYHDLPRVEGETKLARLKAWEAGQTGIPMIDACMRCLIKTGYINFRMRAMLVSFLCHNLMLDWRDGVQHLARLFLDFEPGIHYSQFQMQAGVTGFNTIRIYNPVKQGEEKDPDGEFVKTWLPALAQIPAPLIHAPWTLSDMEQLMYGIELGVDYPKPIVEVTQSYKEAQALMWQWRKKPEVEREVFKLLQRHVCLVQAKS